MTTHLNTQSPTHLSPAQTAQALPYPALARHLEALLRDPSVTVPARLVQPLAGGGSFFVMPATDARLAISKLITFIPDNATRALPSIQGDVVVFDATTGQRLCILDGPTVTARRTAAVSLLAAQKLARNTDGPLLVVGAGVQGHSHVEAFVAGLGVREVWVASRSAASADALVRHCHSLGLRALRVDDADAALADCPLVVSTTSAQAVALRAMPRSDAFVAAVGAFTPRMVEWDAAICRRLGVAKVSKTDRTPFSPSSPHFPNFSFFGAVVGHRLGGDFVPRRGAGGGGAVSRPPPGRHVRHARRRGPRRLCRREPLHRDPGRWVECGGS
jgi:ornithine cyclodeaminase